jgi:hypothetical protein
VNEIATAFYAASLVGFLVISGDINKIIFYSSRFYNLGPGQCSRCSD